MSKSQYVKECEGKTIKRIDDRATNVKVIYFTDGTKLTIEVEALAPGTLYGIVLGD